MLNNNGKYLLTSESVTEGHPDKMGDQISDAILDEVLRHDPYGRVAVETLLTTGLVIIAGEITTNAHINIPDIVRKVIKEIGYTNSEYGFDAETCGIQVSIQKQSLDIARGVSHYRQEEPEKVGAGDQGIMYGYATNETKELMPLPIVLAHKLTKQLAYLRKKGVLKYLRPDGKSQVTVEYVNGKPKRVHTVLVSTQHDPTVSNEELTKDITKHVIRKIIPRKLLNKETKILVNPTGRFVIGGPHGDTGLTGRKIIVDTYGGVGSHGGGAFCVAGDSLINVENGLCPIFELSSIKPGTLIKTDISPTPLGNWINNGIMETLAVTTKDGYRLEGTPNQCIRVVDKNGDYVWRRFDSLQNTDNIAIQRKNRMFGKINEIDFKFKHKKGTYRKNSFNFPKELTEDYAYLLGLLIGDGRCTTRDGVQLCVCEKEMKILVQGLFKKLFGESGKIFGHWAFFCGVELRAYLEILGLDYQRSWNKHVPHLVFKAPKQIVAKFIRGLFDTDGTTRITGRNNNSPEINLATTSKQLALEIQQLLLNFGIISNIQITESTGSKSIIRNHIVISRRPLYHLRIKGSVGIKIFKQEIGFGLPRKAKILNSIKIFEKRDLITIPNQRERVRRLWQKLTSREHQADSVKIGRWLRDPSTKGTKELTYSKLVEFLDYYENRFAGDFDFEYLKTYYILNHYYTKINSKKRGRNHVYDFTVPGIHTFIANGFICHNSGKDPTKVDRSASYAARWVAKNIVAAKLADKTEVQISYAIGVPEPLAVNVNTFGTGKRNDGKIKEAILQVFDLRPGMIIKHLNLRRPIYRQTAAYGHFGRDDLRLPWEKTNKVKELRKCLL